MPSGVEGTLMHIRTLAALGDDALRARIGELVDGADAEALLDAATVPLLTVDAPPADRDSALALLRAVGATAAVATNGTLVVVASRDRLRRALAQADEGDPPVLHALLDAHDRLAAPPRELRARTRTLDLTGEALVMGIVNATPDSFHERAGGVEDALAMAHAIAADGGAIVDVGGRSYAHWNTPPTAEEEAARVVPVVRAIRDAGLDLVISIDTVRASVADAALAAGADLINDCSGLGDPAMAATVARYGAGLVVMHLKGELNVRNVEAYAYGDVTGEIVEWLRARTDAALAAGVARNAIAIDPGLEFGKEPQTDLAILERFGELNVLGYPVLLASSRKSFIGRIFGKPARELLVPSLATAALAITAGARILRVHDVAATVQLARMMAAVAPRRRAALRIADRMPGTPAAAGNSRDGRAV